VFESWFVKFAVHILAGVTNLLYKFTL
jgi:hypothetical protein